MKVLMVNGSPRRNGNTARALKEVADTLAKEGVDSEVVWIGVQPVRGCIACGQCQKKSLGRCAFDDDIANRIVDVEKLADADGIVLGSPTYYGQPNGTLLAVWQRVCFSASARVQGKPAACIAVCRRGGSTAAYQTMNMPFEMLNCPLVTSQYWNIAFGRAEGECGADTEGMPLPDSCRRRDAEPRPRLRVGGGRGRENPSAQGIRRFVRQVKCQGS